MTPEEPTEHADVSSEITRRGLLGRLALLPFAGPIILKAATSMPSIPLPTERLRIYCIGQLGADTTRLLRHVTTGDAHRLWRGAWTDASGAVYGWVDRFGQVWRARPPIVGAP